MTLNFDRRAASGVVFFFSGAAALIYQVAWQRVLTQAIGVDALSIAFIITIFMVGLGFGSLYGGIVAYCNRSRLAIVYGFLELLIALFGFFSVTLLRSANRFYAGFGIQSISSDFLFNLVVMIAPIFVMGMTTPVFIEFLKDRKENFGRTVGWLYGINVAGASAGALATLFLIEWFGLQGTTRLAAFLNLLIAIYFFAIAASSRTIKLLKPIDETAKIKRITSSPIGINIGIASFLFGFASLSIQMVLLRLIMFYFTPASFVFPIGLSAFLIMMTVGQICGGVIVDKTTEYRRSLLPFLVVIACILATLLILNVPLSWLDLLRPSTSTNIEFLPAAMAYALMFMIPVAFVSALLPIMTRVALKQFDESSLVFSRILFLSTLGNILGTYLTSLVLFDWLGSVGSLLVIFCALLIGAFSALEPDSMKLKEILRYPVTVSMFVACIFFVALFLPRNYYGQQRSGSLPFIQLISSDKPVAVYEGHSDVTPVFQNGKVPARFEVRPFNAGASAALNDSNLVFYRYYSLSVPLMIDPRFRPRKILLIGLGSGELPFVMRMLPFVEEFHIVELSPSVMKAYEERSAPDIAATLKDPKIKLHITDGRRFIQQAVAKNEKFDLIQIGILGLTLAGASNIYSQDLFRDVSKILTEDGYLALEPYIGVARLGFDLLPYGYTLAGSSWLFMSKHRAASSSEAHITAGRLETNLYNATTLEQIKLAATHAPVCQSIPIEINVFDKQDVIAMFKDMVGTDDRLIFEYFYTSELSKDFTWPVKKIYDIPELPRSNLKIKACPDGCDCRAAAL